MDAAERHRDISIHALREEGDIARWREHTHKRRFLSTPSARRATDKVAKSYSGLFISIHALREEGDHSSRAVWMRPKSFLSTPSARRATDAGHIR